MFQSGPNKYKAYIEPAGKGYEVGFMHGKKPLFVGNFVRKTEAMEWYAKMNSEFSHFSKKFWHNPQAPVGTAFYHKFVSTNLYKHYYDFLDKCFGKHTKSYHREFSKDVRTFNKIKKSWPNKAPQPYVRKVA